MSVHLSKSFLRGAFGLLFGLALLQTAEASPSLTMSANSLNQFFEGQGSSLVDDSVSVVADAGGNLIDAARVTVFTNFDSANDSFAINGNSSGTLFGNINYSFDASKGVFSLDGSNTAGNYQSALRQVSFLSTSSGNINKEVAMSLGTLLPFKGTDHTSFHFYEFVNAPGITWIAANVATDSRLYQNTVQGYLMTLTTDSENTFALTKFQENAWVGASDRVSEDEWRWITGPEGDEDGGQGRYFWDDSSGTGASVNGHYNNWAAAEPNDWGSGEDYAHFWENAGGLWNDFRVNNGSIGGYLVEYGVGTNVNMIVENIPFVDNVQTSYVANRSPQNINSSISSFPENFTYFLGFPMATITGIDPDEVEGHPSEYVTISLDSTASYPDNAFFAVNNTSANTSSLTTAVAITFDRETKSFYTLGLTASDNFGNTYSQEIILSITDDPEAPEFSPTTLSTNINEDHGLLNLSFILEDPESATSSLDFTTTPPSSSNTSLVTNGDNLSISSVSGNVLTLSVNVTPDAFGSTTLVVTAIDGGGLVGTTTITLSVNSINDAPVHNIVSDVITTEDSQVFFTGSQALSFTDIDLSSGNVSISLQADVGSLSLLQPLGASLTFSSGNGSSNSTLAFTGGASDVNAAMSNVIYTPPLNFFGTDNLQWLTSDEGHSGFGGSLTDQNTILITLNPVNDRPLLNVVANLSFNSILEDSGPSSGNSWSEMRATGPVNLWEDVDTSPADSIAVVGANTQGLGTWQVSTNGGVSWSSLPSVSIANAYLLRSNARFRFDPASNANGSANLSFRAWDETDAALPGSFADTTTITNSGAFSSNLITLDQVIQAVNDAPIWSAPASSGNTSEDVAIAQGPFSINDLEFDTSDNAIITLTVFNGSANLSSTDNLNFTSGNGSSNTFMVFEGNTQAINDALSSILFIPDLNFNGTALITVSGNDQGLSGIGGNLSSDASVIILVNQVNDAPNLNDLLNLGWDTKLEDTIDSSGNSITEILTAITGQNAYSDIDESVPNLISLPDGIAITTWSSANGQWQMTFNGGGSWTDFPTYSSNALLLGEQVGTAIRFVPTLHHFGNEYLSIRAWDGTDYISGNTISISTTGGNLSFSDNLATLTLPIAAVNDAPFINGPAAVVEVTEEVPHSFGPAANLISIDDIEASSNTSALMELSLASSSGNLELASLTGLSFQGGSANAMSNVTIQGTLSNLSAAINGMVFRSHRDLTGSATIALRLNDLDTTEPSPLESTLTLNLSIANVNDIPVLSDLDPNLTYTENTTLSLASSSNVTDVDDTFIEGANIFINTNLMAQDLLSISSSGNVVSSYNNLTGELSLTGRDTKSTYQTVLRTLSFTHLGDDPNDQGSKNTRELLSTLYDEEASSVTVVQTLSISSINDAPVISSWNSTPTYTEGDSVLTLDNDVSISDGDNPTLTRLSILLTTFQSGDLLSITPGANMTLGTDPSGNLSYTGPFSLAEATAALQSLTYQSSSEDPNILGTQPNRNINVEVADGTFSSNVSLTLSVVSINDAPTLTNSGNFSVDEDTQINLNSMPITLSDVDGNSGSNLELNLTVSGGNLIHNGSFSTNLSFPGSLTTLQSNLNSTNFLPSGNFFGNITFDLSLNDMGNSGLGGQQVTPLSLTISVNAINDAPILQITNRVLASIDEDTTDPAGNTIEDGLILNGVELVSDADPSDGQGVAIIDQSIADGTWQYSLDGASSWFDFPTITNTSALVLDDLAFIRFVPASDFNGTATLTYHAWDGSDGVTSGTNSIDTTSTGGSNPFSTDTGTWSMTVEPLNDTPSIIVPGPITLTEDTRLSLGGTNASTLSDEDADTGTLELTLTASSGNILDGSSLENPLVRTGTLSSLQTLLDSLDYEPSGNVNGSVALNLNLNDLGNTGAGGNRQSTETISITITAVNDAPVLNPFSLSLNDINEDETNSAGNTILDLLSPNGTFAISDPDPSAVFGIALTGTNTLSSQGSWEFSLNGGGSWSSTGTLSDNHALVLDTSSMVRFVPAADFNGGANLSFRAWDQSSGLTPGFSGIDATSTGDAHAFSDAQGSWELYVTPVNDAPLVTAPPALFSDEDTALTITGFNIADPDLSGNDSVQITVSAQDGVVSNSVGNTGASFTLIDTIDNINVWLGTGLTYQPPTNFNSVAGNITSIEVEVNDQGSTGVGGNLSSSDTIALYIGAVNDAPILLSGLWTSGVNLLEDDTASSGWAPSTFSFNNLAALTDVDSAELPAGDNVFDGYGLAFTTLGDEVDGSWESSLNNGGSWSTIPDMAGNALLLSLDGQHHLRFVPNTNANGNLSISFRAWDRSSGVAGNLVAISSTGGESSFSTTEHTMSLAVLPVNDAPTLSTTTLPLSVDEDSTLTLSSAFGNGITPGDVDISQSATMSLSLSTTLGNLHLGSIENLLFTSGANASKDMTITGNLIALRNSLEGLRYLPDLDLNGLDQLLVVLNDEGQVGGGNLTASQNLTVLIQSLNDNPIIENLDGDTSTFTENGNALSFDQAPAVLLSDVDSINFNGGRLVIEGIDGGTRNDRITLEGTASVNLTGTTITFSSNAVGTWTDNSDEQASITLSFSSDLATPAVVQDILRQLRYENDSDIPSPSTRSFNVELHDGDGGLAIASFRIGVVPINDDPVLTLNTLQSIYIEDQGPWQVFSDNVNLNDVDSDDFINGRWTVKAESGFVSEDTWSWSLPSDYSLVGSQLNWQGNEIATVETFNSGITALSLLFSSSSANSTRALEIIESLTYTNSNQAPNTGERAISVVFSDGDGGLSETLRHRFNVQAVNDAPIMVMGTSLNIGAIFEDTTDDLGQTVSDVLAIELGLVTELDGSPTSGILVRPDQDWSHAGTWATRLASGTWQDLPSHSSLTGTLLGPNDRIRFTPSPNWFGTLSDGLEIWAWDRSEGFSGDTHTLISQGGTSAFSLNSRQVELTITAIPEPPTVSDNTIQGAKYAQRNSTWEDFTENFDDVDVDDDGNGDVLQAVRIDRLPSNGNLLFNGNSISLGQSVSQSNISLLTYRPYDSYTGADNWAWSAFDGLFYSPTSANLSIDILPVAANLLFLATDVVEDVSRVNFQITLSNPSTQTVSVDLAWQSGNLLPYGDFVLNNQRVDIPQGTTTFVANLIILDDLVVEDDESASFMLTNPSFLDLGSDIQSDLIVRDNDTALSGDLDSDEDLIIQWLDPAWVSEDGDTARLSIRMAEAPTSTISLSLGVSDSTEASLSQSVLSFTPANGTSSQVITVTGLDDTVLDGPIDLGITLSPSDNTLKGRVLPLINRDNDTQGFVVLTPIDLTTSEDGAQTLVLVQLQQAPNADVTLVTSLDTNQIEASSTSLSFTNSNWDHPQALVLTGLDNNTIEGDRRLNLSWLPAISTDTSASGLRPRLLSILHRDNDLTTPGVGSNRPPFRLILEANTLSPNSLEAVTITFAAEDPEEVDQLRGGIVKMDLLLGNKTAFRLHQHHSGSQVILPFLEAGPVELELRAMDLQGAISTKKLNLMVSSSTTSPITNEFQTVSSQAPYTHTWNWQSIVSNPSLIQSVSVDHDGDGKIDQSGLASDSKINSMSHTYDEGGQYRSDLFLLLNSGERFKASTRLLLSSPNTALPELSLSSSMSSTTAPSTLTLTGTWVGTVPGVDRVLWSFGLDPEHSFDLIDDDLEITLPITRPGSLEVVATAILIDGRRVTSRHDLHINSRGEPLINPVDERLRPFQTTLGIGHPLLMETWPSQTNTISIQHYIGSSIAELSSVDGIASIMNDPFSASRYHQTQSQLNFDDENWSFNTSRQWNVDRDLQSTISPSDQSDLFRVPWQPRLSSSVLTFDGSGLRLPAQDLDSPEGSLTVTRRLDSGLNLQGVPLHLETLKRDVQVLPISSTTLEEPNGPVEILLAYDDIDQDGLVDGLNIPESQLICLRFDVTLNRWVPVEGFYTHPDLNVVRAKSYHLSTFGLFYPGARDLGSENSSGGGCLLKP